MNVPEINWWNELKEKAVASREIMEQVEKMTSAEREAINQKYQIADKKTRDRLELTIQAIAVFRSYGLEKKIS